MGFFKRKPKLTDDAEKSIRAELKPQDFAGTPKEPSWSETRYTDHALACLRVASTAKKVHEQEWLVNKAMEAGNQWVEYRDKTNRLESIKDPDDPYRTYYTANYIRSTVEQLQQRATQSKPEPVFAPYTSSPTDQGAAAEARDINDYCERKFSMQSVWLEWCNSTLITSTTFRKVGWNPMADALLWTRQADGSIELHDAEGAGDFEESQVPSHEAFPDPRARGDINRGAWFIHKRRYPLSWFQINHGERGERVNPSASTESSWVEATIDGITGDGQRGGDQEEQADYIEYWELPSSRFPDGRLWMVGGDVLLVEPTEEATKWPYDDRDRFPFVPLTYTPRSESVWGVGAVSGLVPIQRTINNVMSRWVDRVNTLKPTILMNRASKISVGAFQSRRNFEKIMYTGERPSYEIPPDNMQAYEQLLNTLLKQLYDVSGCHEVSQGQVPTGVDSGIAIELLRESDTSRLAGFAQNIETADKILCEMRLSRAIQFVNEPRYLALSQSPDLQSADDNARDFRNIAAGGKVHVQIKAGSALSKSAAAEKQRIMDMFKAGLFLPANLPVTAEMLDVLGLVESNQLEAKLKAIVQIQLQAAAQAAQQPMEIAKMQEEQKAAAQQQEIQGKIQIAEASSQADTQGKIMLEKIKQAGQAQLLDIENAFELHAAQADSEPKISMSITGKATPEEVVSAGEKLGLDAGTVASAKDANKPPVAAKPTDAK